MTRRITLAILLTVWAMLIASGLAAYLTTRAVLLRNLDETLIAQASALPELLQSPGRPASPPLAVAARPAGAGAAAPAGEDRYLIQSAGDGRTLSRAPGASSAPPAGWRGPTVLSRTFSTLATGERVRAVTLRALSRPAAPGDAPAPVLVTYTRSAEPFHALLDRLALTLWGCGLAGGLLAAAIAYRVSRAALRPLRGAADIVGSIDERRLDRRIGTENLPLELVPVAERINQMLDRLQASFTQRRQFLADASHELRTPVAALVTGLEVALARPRSAEAYQAALAGALADAMQLRGLVTRLLEQVRGERFDHDEPARWVELAPLLGPCIASARTLAAARGVRVECDDSPGLAAWTQPGRLLSVAANLISNAVEYNREGGTVVIRSGPAGDGGVELTVRDTGPGIEPGKLPHLFEPFFRADSAHRADAGHLGLGLYLVKTHLDALDGRCTVESEPGVGSVFRVTLPPPPAGAEPAPAGRAAGAIAWREPRRPAQATPGTNGA